MLCSGVIRASGQSRAGLKGLARAVDGAIKWGMNPSKYVITTWRAEDRDAAIELIVGIQAGEFGLAITRADQPDLEDVARFYGAGASGFWLAREIGGGIVGTIALTDIGDGVGVLRKMFVAPAHRGAVHGVGQGLMDHLVGHAGAQDLSTIVLGTTAAFVGAHRFYEKNGFVKINPAALPSAFPRMPLDDRFYQMNLVD